MEETDISETLALVEDLVKSRREELQLVFFDWMQHLHSNLVVLFVLLCSLVVSCYPDIPKQASLNLMLKIEHARVNPRAYLARTREDRSVDIIVFKAVRRVKPLDPLFIF
jgi:hypothetical protein